MNLYVLGVNHRTAPLAVREKLSFSDQQCPTALTQLLGVSGVHEAALLSTCNRTDIFLVAEQLPAAVSWLSDYHQIDTTLLGQYLYEHQDAAAVHHVLRVACGLDSMVIGETQILGQMKTAMRLAESSGALGTQLHKLFQLAFEMAKTVRSQTEIGAHTVSMAAAAVQLSLRIFPHIEDRKLLFIGAGEMIESCLAHFAARQPRSIVVANRTVERANELALRYSGTGVRIEKISEIMSDFDIVISCTASPLPLIGLGMIERAIRQRRHQPMFMLDLAVPRDIEAEVGALDDVFLYTVDDLADIVSHGQQQRSATVDEAEKLIQAGISQFESWQDARSSVPLIRQLRDNAERIRRHEVERAMKHLAHGDEPLAVLTELSQRLTNKFLHAPSHTLARAEPHMRQQLNWAAEYLFHLHGTHPDSASN